MFNVTVEQFNHLPAIDKVEALRYACAKREIGESLSALLDECIQEAEHTFLGKICSVVLSKNELFDFIPECNESEALKKNLLDCDSVVLFSATVGAEIDRLIHRYAKISPAKSLLFQAIGAERIECLCDCFCENLKQKYASCDRFLKPRFSPGYGDFSLSAQTAIFNILNPQKHLGMFLTESLLILPTKSVTAVVGLGREMETKHTCEDCNQVDCGFKRN